MKKVLDSILEQALEQALAGLTARARDMVEQALEQALAARVQALLEDEGLTLAPAPAPARAKAQAQAALAAQASPALDPQAQAAPVKPRKRAKAQAQAQAQDSLEAILEAGQAALEKYRGITTPKGKGLPEVLGRRLRNTLRHAQALGRQDLQALAQRALALIDIDPKGAAMQSWQALAARVGLPVPVAQAQGGEE